MREAIQLCPNDHPPFLEVCKGHARALELCGYTVRTAFFESRGFIRSSGFSGRFDVVPIDRVLAFFRSDRPALLVSHRYRGYRAGIPLAHRLSIPVHVAVAHEFGFFDRFSRRWRRRIAGDGGCRFAGVSNAVADDFRAAGVAAPVVLPNPVDADELRRALRSRTDARAELGLSGGDFVIGVVGRLHPKKDPVRALHAFERYLPGNPGARLVFLGDGVLRGELERRAGAGVLLAGFRADARHLLRAFDVVLSCSTAREAFGLALLEAMVADVPVICADRPGPRFVLGDWATYFDSDTELLGALERLAEDRLSVDGSKRRQQIDQFSTDALAGRYRAMLV